MKVLWYEPRLTFLMPGLASSLSPAISTQLITLVSKNKPFSKYRVSASVNELSVDHLQLILSVRSPIHANSATFHYPPHSAVARSAQFFATSLSFSLVLRQLGDFLKTTSESVNDAENKYCTFGACQKLKIYRVVHGTVSRELLSNEKSGTRMREIKTF